jgi:hypothetical protein
MARILPILLSLGLTIYALLDCAQSEQERIRNLPKWAWLILIIVFQLIGSLAWLIAGKPRKLRQRKPRILPPDDDPDFLGSL